MKHPNFWIKLLSLLLIGGGLFYYQAVAGQRAAAAAQNEAEIEEVEAYNREILRQQEARKQQAEPAETEEPGLYRSGRYEGEGTGYGGPIRVAVTITDGTIESIEVLEHDGEDPAYYMLAEALLDEMTQTQSAEVDAATGATFSSAGIRQAVSAALAQAVR